MLKCGEVGEGLKAGPVETVVFERKVCLDGDFKPSLIGLGASRGDISTRTLETVSMKFPISTSVALLVSRKFACVKGRLSVWPVDVGLGEPKVGETWPERMGDPRM